MLLVGQVDGPVVPVQVVVWPVHLTEAGQVEMVITVLEVIVELE